MHAHNAKIEFRSTVSLRFWKSEA